jgi:hypothetical protein
MKFIGITINGKIILQILFSIVLGWLVGSAINYINVFGSSEKAPLICALVLGAISLGRLIRQQNEGKVQK